MQLKKLQTELKKFFFSFYHFTPCCNKEWIWIMPISFAFFLFLTWLLETTSKLVIFFSFIIANALEASKSSLTIIGFLVSLYARRRPKSFPPKHNGVPNRPLAQHTLAGQAATRRPGGRPPTLYTWVRRTIIYNRVKMKCKALFSSFLAVTNRFWGADLPLEVIRWIYSLIE